MSDDVRLDFTVPYNVYEEGKTLVNDNRNKTSNSRDSKAYYGRTIYKLGLEKLKELQKEKERQAVDFRETENRIKNLIEDKDLSGVV